MSFSEIIIWIFSHLRPVLWCMHRLGQVIELASRVFEDEACLNWLADNPHGRADVESKIADAEHMLDIAIGLRARELLGMPMLSLQPTFARIARVHAPPSLGRLTLRFARLIERTQHIERLARLRAERIRREQDAAPVLLVADHRPEPIDPAHAVIAWLMSQARPAALPRTLALNVADTRIRAPP